MGISRIESAYAYFLDKKGISGTQMAVLQALSFCANELNHEECHPSIAYLAQLTHFSESRISPACQALRDMNAIDWIPGGQYNGMNLANTYAFKFPLVKMKKKRERYEAINQERVGCPRSEPPVPSLRTPGTPAAREGHPRSEGGVPPQRETNKEYKEESNPQSNSESKGAPPTFDLGSVLKSVSDSGRHDPRSANGSIDDVVHDRSVSPHYAALRVCGVDDVDNKKTFNNYALAFYNLGKMDAMFDVIETFWGEIKAGEHDGVQNRAAVLTSRLKYRLAQFKSASGRLT